MPEFLPQMREDTAPTGHEYCASSRPHPVGGGLNRRPKHMNSVFQSRTWRTIALTAAATAALGCANAANATTYFTATSSSGSSITMSNLLFTSFNNGFYDVRFAGQCGSCITATSGTGSALGTFDFSVNGL